VEARIVDGEKPLCLFVGVFGASRSSAVEMRPEQPPVPDSNAIQYPWLPGITPNFTQHFSAQWLVGAPPRSGDTRADNVLSLAMRDQGNATEYHVVAMADYIPPVALSWLESLVPAASLSWMLELLPENVTSLPLEGWRIDAQMTAADGGYTHQSLTLWGPGGVLIALGRQTMMVFD
jgi:hypothetical protein